MMWARWLLAACAIVPMQAAAQLRPVAQPNTNLNSSHAHDQAVAAGEATQTRMRAAMPARESYLRPVQRSGALHNVQAETTLRPAAGTATRLDRVQQLRQSLNARETEHNELVIDLPTDVLFDFDKSTLRPDAIPVLARAAQLIEAYPQHPVCIHGHTDSKGSNAYNEALSLRRAQAVAVQLQQSQPARQMRMRGFGESRPVAANTLPDGADNPEGRQRNRRVEIVIGNLAGRAVAAQQQKGGASCL